jgi:hypothetical protein
MKGESRVTLLARAAPAHVWRPGVVEMTDPGDIRVGTAS